MTQTITVGIVGDYNPDNRFHAATNQSLHHAAGILAVTVDIHWLSTESLDDASAQNTLRGYDALWCAPSSPYTSMEGALNGIRYAREERVPFIGT